MKMVIIKVMSMKGVPDGASLIRPTEKQFWSFVGRVSAAPPGKKMAGFLIKGVCHYLNIREHHAIPRRFPVQMDKVQVPFILVQNVRDHLLLAVIHQIIPLATLQ